MPSPAPRTPYLARIDIAAVISIISDSPCPLSFKTSKILSIIWAVSRSLIEFLGGEVADDNIPDSDEFEDDVDVVDKNEDERNEDVGEKIEDVGEKNELVDEVNDEEDDEEEVEVNNQLSWPDVVNDEDEDETSSPKILFKIRTQAFLILSTGPIIVIHRSDDEKSVHFCDI